jgi:GTP diphosphokinase / guanosine-3',5'-bis(diphosphate) 3'-diphosphatase
MGPTGVSFEVQIRTEEMHRIAEEGIAAHWKYKEGRRGRAEDDQRIAWLRQLVEWQREMRDPGDFMSNLKVDLYPEEVYCFTPKGQGRRAAARRDAGRFRLRHPHRRRPHLHGAPRSTAA